MRLYVAALTAAMTLALGAPGAIAKPKTGDLLVAASQDQPGQLVVFSSDRPNKAQVYALTGPAGMDNLIGLDTRPATGNLYAIGSVGTLYTITLNHPARTAASAFASQALSPLVGDFFGVDFNPVPDRLRVISDQEQNLRINPDNGQTFIDSPLSYAPGDPNAGRNPDAVGAAYENNVAGATDTRLFDIDAAQDVLALQNPPNAGLLTTIGPLTVDTTRYVGFDITPPARGATPYAVLDPKGHGSRLYVIDLATGKARQVNQVGLSHPFHLDSLAAFGAAP
jgi:hypothetical protein